MSKVGEHFREKEEMEKYGKFAIINGDGRKRDG